MSTTTHDESDSDSSNSDSHGKSSGEHHDVPKLTLPIWRDEQEDSRKTALLNWLAPVRYTAEQADISHRRHPNTGRWLLESSQFQQWLRQPGQTLLCHGMPGAGKTILTSLVVDHLVTAFASTASSSSSPMGVAFVYCDSRRRSEQRPIHLLSDILRQSLDCLPRVPRDLESMYSEYSGRLERPSMEVIVDALRMVAKTELEKMFVVVDDVDEGLEEEDRGVFLAELGNLQSMTGVSVFVTAKEEVVGCGSSLFDQALKLEIRAEVGDVRRYVEDNVPRILPVVVGDAVLMEQVVQGVVDRADGIFLLANLTLALLASYTTPQDVRDALETTLRSSTTLEDAHTLLLERTNPQNETTRDYAYRILLWIVYTTRPLAVTELQHGLSMSQTPPDLDEDIILRICAGLLVINKTQVTIRPIHHTTQDYLERHLSAQRCQAEADIAVACIKYLSRDEVSQPTRFYGRLVQKQQPSSPFYSYAAHNWAHHVRNAGLQTDPLLLKFLRDDKKASSAAREVTTRFIDRCTGLHLAAYFGLEDTAEALLTGRTCIRPYSKTDKGTALSVAAHNGHIAIVRLLLATGPSEIVNQTDSFGRVPLHYAAAGAHEDIFVLLLEHRHTSIDVVDITQQTPLLIAAREGLHESVDLLLSSGRYVDINRRDKYGWTPLLYAVESGHEQIVHRLLATPNIDISGRGTKHESFSKPHTYTYPPPPRKKPTLRDRLTQRTTRLVLSNTVGDGGIDGRPHFPGDPIHLTSIDEEDPTPTATKPLSSTAAVNKRPGLTLLGVALQKGFPAIAAQLLHAGAERDVHSLLFAAEKGYVVVIQALLQGGGGDGMSPDAMHPRDGQTPLRCAAECGHTAAVETLLSFGANAHFRHPRSGRTVLMAAAENGFVEIVKLLVDRCGVAVSVEDCRGWTALSLARKFGHDDVVQFLEGRCG